jgi:predicted helicase
MLATKTLPKPIISVYEPQKFSTNDLRRFNRAVALLKQWKNQTTTRFQSAESTLFQAWQIPTDREKEWQDALWQWFFWDIASGDHPIAKDLKRFTNDLKLGLFDRSALGVWDEVPLFQYLFHYDLFLQTYSEKTKKKSATYYTPVELGRFMVRKAIIELEAQYNLQAKDAIWIDFACGTGLFPYLILEATDFNPNVKIYAYEQALAPYGLAHYLFKDFPNVHLLWGNPLNPQESDFDLWESWQDKTLVVIGNPPWSGISQNKGLWITKLIEDYKNINGVPLGERKLWLQDDYVKFIRLGQYWLDHADQGLLAVVSNHNFLDNPTFRGMRHRLMQTFSHAQLIDLKGNIKKGFSPKTDENIFGIETGVAVSFFSKSEQQLSYQYQELSGTKDDKLTRLDTEITGAQVNIQPPYYCFTPQIAIKSSHYERFLPIRELFRTSNIGIVSARDHFLIGFEPESVLERIKFVANPELADETVAELFKLKNTSSFNLSKARKVLFETDENLWREWIIPISYRPLDTRWIFYQNDWVERRVFGTGQHFLKPNVGIVFQRGCSSHHTMNLPQITRHIIDHGFSYPANRAVSYVAPLFCYEGENPVFNLRTDLLAVRSDIVGFELEPEAFFYYIFAVLHSEVYRQKYASELIMDFPRIPLPTDEMSFSALSQIGKKLAQAHLLEIKPVSLQTSELPITVENVKWDGKQQRLYLSKNAWISGFSENELTFALGGYEGIRKFLVSYKKRLLVEDTILHLAKAIAFVRQLPDLIAETDLYLKDRI